MGALAAALEPRFTRSLPAWKRWISRSGRVQRAESPHIRRSPTQEFAVSHVLLILSSPRAESYSTRAAHVLAQRLAPGSTVTVRDLNATPLPHIDDAFAVARSRAPEELTAAQRATLRLSDALIDDLRRADVIIIASAMINFGVSSSLKAYIDHIVRPRVTFRYTDKGVEGLLKGKKAYLVVARGSVFSQAPMQALNYQDTYLRTVLGLVGITDVETVAIEGTASGAEAAEKALADALAKVPALAA
jgi:FMN-dependent NADH-azoreductase